MSRTLSQDIRTLFPEFGRTIRTHSLRLLSAGGLIALAVVLLLRVDVPWSEWIMSERRDVWVRLARGLSFWGDFFPGTVTIAAALCFGGALARRRNWLLAGLACLLAATLAGFVVNVGKTASGRPRPWMGMDDGFYGPVHGREFRSFPSGHTATSMATAGALAAAFPAASIPAFVCAGGVAWSRLYLHQHYPSDVVAGGAIGLLFGLGFGFAARRVSAGKEP